MSSVTSVCPSCHASIRLGQPTCNQCGVFVSSQATSATGQTVPQISLSAGLSFINCTTCGHAIRQGAGFCSSCGTAVGVYFRPLQPGQLLAHGRYCIQNELSKGGMGAIYLATDHEAFDRLVVVKTILDYFDPTDPQQVHSAQDRFLQEARTLSTLKHPAIPQIYSYFQEGSQNYIVMEYIEGRDLEQDLTHEDDSTGRIRPGHPYSHKDVIRWGIAMCRVLEYLASRKPNPVLHLDIKPRNLVQDNNSQDIRLVDFGTAKSRVSAQHNLGASGQKSSIFGTAGYAPPEQYSGQSEPRSDVYALAATLYHLATDDDPRAHPFTFPQLPQFGAFGTVLEAALHQDVDHRSTATAFRQQLESLLTQPNRHPIQTPDGVNVADEQELAKWCEGQWTIAAKWLYNKNKLPEQIERFWGKNKLASDIRGIVQAHASKDAGLDAVLSFLDPQGFGSEEPHIAGDKQELNYGRLAATVQSNQSLTITSTGRRFVQAQIQLPQWITTKNATIKLIPGESVTLTLTANMQRVSAGGKLRSNVLVRDGRTSLLDVSARATVSRWHTLWRHYPGHMVVVSSVLLFAILSISNVAYWETYKAWYYWTARLAIDSQQWDKAADAIIQVEAKDSNYADFPKLMNAHPELVSTIFARRAIAWQSGRVEHTTSLRERPFRQQPDEFDNWERVFAFSPDGQILATAGWDDVVNPSPSHGDIQLWRASDGRLLRTFSVPWHVRQLVFSPDTQNLVAVETGGITMRRVSDGTEIWTINEYAQTIAFAPDGKTLVVYDGDKSISIWQVSGGTHIRTFETSSSNHASIAFSPNGQMFAVTSNTSTIEIWQISNGSLLQTVNSLGAGVTNIEFSPDSQMLAVDYRSLLILWRVQDGNLSSMLPIPMPDYESMSTKGIYDVNDMAFSPDGETLAISNAASVMLLQISDGTLLQVLSHDTRVEQVAFSPDAGMLASGDASGTIKFWRPQR